MKTDSYKTKNGSVFRFGFEQREHDGVTNFVVLILSQPDYKGKSDAPHCTHRTPEGEKFLIDYSGPVPTLDDAKIVAACWADLTERYITTGEVF